MPETIIIAGAGHAAGQTIVSLRQQGFAGDIVLIGEEHYPPYQRPPLSKKFLAGELALERLYVRPEKFYADQGVELQTGTRVESIDRDQQLVSLSNKQERHYDKLVLATGSHVRKINLPDVEPGRVKYLRNIKDVLDIRENFHSGARIVILGAGYIGMEVAAVAIQTGLDVTVLDVAPRVMGRVVCAEVSDFYAQAHRDAGVKLTLSCPVADSIVCDGPTSILIGGDGQEYPADIILVGIGVAPTTDIAEAAGLECDDGIRVDENCQTSDANIFAVGDCTNHINGMFDRRLRLESVHNAQEQAKTAAAAICGQARPYAQMPWFWSDQYDLKLQIAGLSNPDDPAVIRGNPAERSFAAFRYREDHLVAVEAINSPREFMWSKKLLAAGRSVSAELAADGDLDFKGLAEQALS